MRLVTSLLLLTGMLLAWWAWPAQRVPDTTFVLIDGRQLDSRALRGGPLLINFWATSCPTCLQEIPELVALHHDYAARGLTVIGVAMPYDPPDRVVNFARGHHLPYPVALDLQGRVAHAFGDVRLTPTSILVGPRGRILERHTGRLDPASTRARLNRLLGES